MRINVINNFLIYGDFVKAEPFGSGHINDTFLATFNQAGLPVRYIIRRINKNVFKQPETVVHNTINVIEHISKKLLEINEKNVSRKVMTLIKSKDDRFYYIDENKDYWCAVLFLENAYTIDFVETTEQAYKSAKEFGKFQRLLIDDDVNKYQYTIIDFHNTPKRMQQLLDVIQKDPHSRTKSAANEVETALENQFLTERIKKLLDNQQLPLRITHNDTKINNVMLDKSTGEGLCVIDLDTTMPGTVISDFGDMVRTSTCPAAEDEKDISKVVMRIDFFEAIAKGYLEELRSNLAQVEIDNLVYGGELIIFEQAIRFLADYLNGDTYYKIEYKDHNLVRTKNQFALLKSLQQQRSEMEKIISKYRI